MPKSQLKAVQLSDTERRNLLSKRLNELPLKITGSHLETQINKLYGELSKVGITFKPGTYLSDGWGCPDSTPIIGIPFYLADSVIYQILNEFTDPAPWDDSEIMKYLRHECGHALNYAYLLYKEPEWEKFFGSFSKPYKDNYRAIPFDTRFVRHSPSWYAQKHPDEDFAETFAVWLAPESKWRETYDGTPALNKLQYVETLVKQLGKKPAAVTGGELDRPLNELEITLEGWCRMREREGRKKIILPDIINEDLRGLFPDATGEPALDIFQSKSRQIVRDVHNWTGVNRDLLSSLVHELAKRVKSLGLVAEQGKNAECMVNLTAFITTLAMNYQHTGKFVKDE